MIRRVRFLGLVVLLTILASACSGAVQRALVTPTGGSGNDPQAFVPIVRRFVEAHRGLTFKKAVPVTLLSDADFNKKLLGKQGNDAASVEKAAKELEALGLIPGHPDLGALEKALLSAAVSGFYDPKDKRLFVRGVTASPYVRTVIVHELTHAVQDQYFNIDRPELDKSNDERGGAFAGLLEGDAVTIQDQYRHSLSADEQQQAQDEENQGASSVPKDIPRVLLELISFPYIYGPKFVEALRNARGQPGLDAAFRTPPTTSQQVIDPQRYLSRDAGQTVAQPQADGKAFDDGILGEQGLDLLLERAVTGGLSAGKGAAASSAWNGDRYVAWDQSKSVSCIRVAFAARDAQAGQQLATALQAYLKGLPEAHIESAAPLTLRTCG